jgi:uncharacterized membrane protein
MKLRLNDRTHALLLIGALIVGIILRLTNLAGKPLWMDEVITAIFSFGRTYDEIPVERAMSVADLAKFLTLRANATCDEITTNVMTQSVHPPLFFCGLQRWLRWWPQQDWLGWVWWMRSFSVLWGGVAIGLSYGITQFAFRSRRSALFAAWVMAVSPFALYLSQEARHYTLPMAVVMLGLLGLLMIQRDWQKGQINPLVWVGWAACQTLGFYIHYFFLLATVGQVGALMLWQWWYGRSHPAPTQLPWVPVAFVLSAIGFTYAPWLPIFLSHITRPETNWMKPFQPSIWTAIAPLWQLPIGWLSMVVAFPVEHQSLWLLVPTAIAMILFGGWMLHQTVIGWLKLCRNPQTRQPTLMLTGFLGIVVLEFLTIIFVLQKDLTQVPRYNFIYYPAIAILLGASLVEKEKDLDTPLTASPLLNLILVGMLSCQFVNTNLAFQKPYQPERVAANIAGYGNPKTLVVMGYQDYQELAMGMSFVLALRQVDSRVKFAFLNTSTGYDRVIEQFPTLPNTNDFWLIAPGLRQQDFPNLTMVGSKTCRALSDRYYRIGIPYQGYRCQ